MPADANKKTRRKDEEKQKVVMPDYVELWKEMYFKNEDAWSQAFKEFITTQTFVTALDQVKDQMLNYHKISEQNLDSYYKVHPAPSKKDIARVAELVIGLEDKVDDLDLQFSTNINRITTGLIKLVDFNANLKDEIKNLRQENLNMQKKLDDIIAILASKSEEIPTVPTESNPTPKKKPRKKDTGL
ncbi:MAG: hypothetical protein GXY34_06820 [Syntrophomonadaceae bacterium]|nr:hypothetical protein [Syntrophomonadaceae bacterium]